MKALVKALFPVEPSVARRALLGAVRAAAIAVVLTVVLTGVLATAGCAASLPRGHWDASDHRVCAGRVCYVVGALDGNWRMVHQEGAAVGWFHDGAGAIIETNATCRDDAEAAPLRALTRELMVGYSDRHVVDEQLVPMDGREALRTRFDAKLDGVPMSLELIVMKRNGCIFDLSYAAPPATFAVAAPDFSRLVSGFADARPGVAAAARAGS